MHTLQFLVKKSADFANFGDVNCTLWEILWCKVPCMYILVMQSVHCANFGDAKSAHIFRHNWNEDEPFLWQSGSHHWREQGHWVSTSTSGFERILLAGSGSRSTLTNDIVSRLAVSRNYIWIKWNISTNKFLEKFGIMKFSKSRHIGWSLPLKQH